MGFRVLVLALVLGACLGQDCPCPKPDMDYCPQPSSFSTTNPVVCTAFGRGHINTFDGLAYDFREFGDFWLVADKSGQANAQFSAQIRQGACSSAVTQTVPLNQQTSFSSTCGRAVVLLFNNNPIEFSHDVASSSINVYIANALQTPSSSYSFGTIQIEVHPVRYLHPYENLWRDQQPYLVDADFYLRVVDQSPNPAITVDVFFFSSGESVVRIRLTNPTSFGDLGGLCGFPDGCSANDLFLTDSGSFTPSVDAAKQAADYIATVQDSSPKVSAGNLQSGDQFITDPSKPGNWAQYFGTVWRIPTSQVRFNSNPGQIFNSRYYRSDYGGGGGSCNSQWPKFLDSACAFDASNGGDPDGWNKLSSLQVMLEYCMDYCQNGEFTYQNPGLQSWQCNGICQYPDDVSISINAPYGPGMLPPITATPNMNGPSFVFASTLNLEGTYWFNLMTTDFCETRAINVSRTLTCKQGVDVLTPNTRYVSNTNGYDWPQVWLMADIDNSATRVSWVFLDWPGRDLLFPAPTISNDISMLPSFQPANPGTYVLEYALYNGCAIKKQNFTVVALCASCLPVAEIELTQLKEILWGLDFDDASTGPVLSAFPTYPPKQLNSVDRTQDQPYWVSLSHKWQILDDNFTIDELEFITANGANAFNVNRYNNTADRDFALMYPAGQQTYIGENSTMANITLPPTTVGPPLTLPALKGPMNTQYGVSPPQREFVISRNARRISTQNIIMEVTVNTTQLTTVAALLPCILQFSDTGSKIPTLSPLPQPTSTQETWTQGSLCVRDYELELNVSQQFCNSSADVQRVEVDCGPAPEVYVNCPSQVPYFYNARLWAAATIDTSASVDPYGRGLSYDYSFDSMPAASTLIDDDLCTRYDCPSDTVSFTPDAPGTYTVNVGVSNGCSSSTSPATITAYCDPFTLTAGFSWTTTPLTYTTFPISDVVIDSAATTSTSVGGFLTYNYTLSTALTDPYPGLIPPLVPAPGVLSASNVVNPTFTAHLPGAYTITQTVSHGCNQFASTSVPITVVCNQVITPTFTINGQAYNTPSLSFTWTAGAWPILNMDATGTGFAPNTAPPTTVNQQIPWYFGNALISVNSNTLAFAPPISTLPGRYNISIIPNDGCIYNRALALFDLVCPTLTATIDSTGWPAGWPIVSSGTTITLNATGSTAGTSVQWSIVSQPAASTATIVNAASTIATFTPLAKTGAGEQYTILLTVSDGCSTRNATVSFTVTCPNALVASIVTTYPVSGVDQVSWRSNAFGRVDLDGRNSNIGGRTVSTISYTWQVLSAPGLSVFSTDPTVGVGTTISITSSSVTNGTYTYITTLNTTTTTTTTTTFDVVLVNSNPTNPQTPFPTCIYPDLAGDYTVQLTLSDSCQSSTAVATILASCDGNPTVFATVTEAPHSQETFVSANASSSPDHPIYNIALSRAKPRRVVLNAADSFGSSNSRLTFYWAWTEFANTSTAQTGIEEPYAAQAALEIKAAGVYDLIVFVHDGCAQASLPVTLVASCGALDLDVEEEESLQVNNGGSNPTTLQTFIIEEESQDNCAYTNQWQFYNFTTASAAENIRPSQVMMVSSTLMSMALLIFFH